MILALNNICSKVGMIIFIAVTDNNKKNEQKADRFLKMPLKYISLCPPNSSNKLYFMSSLSRNIIWCDY